MSDELRNRLDENGSEDATGNKSHRIERPPQVSLICPFALAVLRFSKKTEDAEALVSRVRDIDDIPDWVLGGG